jgi:hypothetical protein
MTAAGVRQRGDVFSGGSYASGSDPRIHFGLGSVDRVEIFWPSGLRQELSLSSVDRIFTIVEGKAPAEDRSIETNSKEICILSTYLAHSGGGTIQPNHGEKVSTFDQSFALPQYPMASRESKSK